MAKKTAKRKKPLLTPEEKKIIRAARKILKRLSKKWNKLNDEAWSHEQVDLTATNEFLDELYPDYINILDDNAFIDLEN